jgi:hypothetical protein
MTCIKVQLSIKRWPCVHKDYIVVQLGLGRTYEVFKISFATMPHALGAFMGLDILHFVVFLAAMKSSISDEVTQCIRKKPKRDVSVLHRNCKGLL